jgi:hypothetical protein
MARAPEKELAGAGAKAEAAPKKVGASRVRESFIMVSGIKDLSFMRRAGIYFTDLFLDG